MVRRDWIGLVLYLRRWRDGSHHADVARALQSKSALVLDSVSSSPVDFFQHVAEERAEPGRKIAIWHHAIAEELDETGRYSCRWHELAGQVLDRAIVGGVLRTSVDEWPLQLGESGLFITAALAARGEDRSMLILHSNEGRQVELILEA